MHVSITAALALFGALAGTARGWGFNVTTGQSDEDIAAALFALGREFDSFRQPGTRPFPYLPEGTDTIPGIEHIVFLMMENHSFDNVFGMLGRGDGLIKGFDGKVLNTNPYLNGSLQHAFSMPNTCQLPSRPSQEWLASHNAFDNGTNQGFVRTPISITIPDIVGGVAMGYYTDYHLPFTYSLAEQFPIGDRFFCSVMSQTWPNRRYVGIYLYTNWISVQFRMKMAFGEVLPRIPEKQSSVNYPCKIIRLYFVLWLDFQSL